MKIERVTAREIFNSRGYPTIQCEIFLEDGSSVSASVPSGTSVSPFEAVELYDGGSRFGGKGVQKALSNIEQIIGPMLVGKEPLSVEMDLALIELDGTSDKSRLGANALLAVSMALYRAEAYSEGIELFELIAALCEADTVSMPFPLVNIINGGVHADNSLQFQEFLLLPVGAQTYRTAFEVAVNAFHELGALLRARGKSRSVGLEGGYACSFSSEREVLDILLELIEKINSNSSISCVISLDVAASQFYDSQTGLYTLHGEQFNTDQMISYYEKLLTQYPLYGIEDGLAAQDWQGWKDLTQALGSKVQIIGDDLIATDIQRIALAIEEQLVTSVIIKPNQVGTVTEAIQAINFCKLTGVSTIVSHRSADTEDTFIADLAVGTSAGQIKAGSVTRSERVAKYNRLLAIEDELTFSSLDADR